jgi:AraC-like DNA-binding protein
MVLSGETTEWWQPSCVVACGVTRDQAAHIDQAVRSRASVRLFSDTATTRSFLRSATERVDAVVIGELGPSGDRSADLVDYVVKDFPGVTVLAFCRAGIEHSATIRALARAGVHELIFVGRDDAGVALRAVVASARRECGADAVFRHLAGVLPRAVHSFIRSGLTHSEAAASLGSLARAMGVNRKTLFKLCTAHYLPPPSELLMWCRIALAAHLHALTGRTLESVALELEFPSVTTLRNRIKAYTGVRASDLRQAGGAVFVAECLRNRLTQFEADRRPASAS